jgi:putative phosphoribosyl transferase
VRRFSFQATTRFTDRREAGRRLAEMVAERLPDLASGQPVVIGLPRGGVLVAAEVAAGLGAPLELLVARKLGVPDQPELALGAVAEGGVRVINEDVRDATRISDAELAVIAGREETAVAAEVSRYRRGRPPLDVADRLVILVDDGLATGATARAAILGLRQRRARRIVLAVPVAPRDTVEAFRALTDDIVVLMTPRPFLSVGSAYLDFTATRDEEVVAALDAGLERQQRS